MDMISVLNDCSVKCYGNVKSKEGPILFQKLIVKSMEYLAHIVLVDSRSSSSNTLGPF